LAGTIVIKLGGSTLGSHDTTLADLVALQKKGVPTVVVHGGANVVTDWLRRMNIPTKFVKGLRVTDAETLKVVVAILAGLVNKELVAAIQALGGRAVGLSGIDGALLGAQVKDPEMGYVGDVGDVHPTALKAVLDAGFIPVVAPLSYQSPPEQGDHGFILNVNGDTAAGRIAAALGAEKLIFLTDVAGILDGSKKLVAQLSRLEAKSMLDSGVASGGMIPKIEACLVALPTVRMTRIIDGRVPHALIKEVEGGMEGTTITADQIGMKKEEGMATLVISASHARARKGGKTFEAILGDGLGPGYAISRNDVAKLVPGSPVVLVRQDRNERRAEGTLVMRPQYTGRNTPQGKRRYDVSIVNLKEVTFRPEQIDRNGVGVY